jgi:hypothetical protein
MATRSNATHSTLAELLATLPECMGADLEAVVCAPARSNSLTCADVVDVAEQLRIDFASAPFSIQQLHLGMAVEADQRTTDAADLLDEDLLDLGKSAVINLQRQPDHYVQLTAAHAPGDLVAVPYHLLDVGTD